MNDILNTHLDDEFEDEPEDYEQVEIQQIVRLVLKDNDIIVLKSNLILSENTKKRIEDMFIDVIKKQQGFENIKCIVLDKDLDLSVILGKEDIDKNCNCMKTK